MANNSDKKIDDLWYDAETRQWLYTDKASVLSQRALLEIQAEEDKKIFEALDNARYTAATGKEIHTTMANNYVANNNTWPIYANNTVYIPAGSYTISTTTLTTPANFTIPGTSTWKYYSDGLGGYDRAKQVPLGPIVHGSCAIKPNRAPREIQEYKGEK